jgi:sugar lactone lactonase YvrE
MKNKSSSVFAPWIVTCSVGIVFLFTPVLCQAQAFTITTVAGGHNNSFQSNGGNGGPAINAYVNTTSGVVVDADGVFYFIDTSSTVRKVSKNGIISTVAGTGIVGFSGDGGLAILAQFNGLSDLALDASGNLYLADSFNNRVRKVSANGIITTVAGGGAGCAVQTNSFGDGCPATSATIGRADSIALDSAGNLFLTDFFNQRVRKVSVNGIITTVAGDGQDHCCLSVDGSPAINAYLTGPTAVAVDAYGNVFIGDYASIRKVSKNGIITTVAGGGLSGFSGDGGTAITAKLSIAPGGMTVDNAGQLYLADYYNNRIRKVAIDGTITTIAGGGTGCAGQTNSLGDGCPATSAKLSSPAAPAIDASGNIYLADSGNGSIRLLNPGTAITLTANAFGEIPLLAPNTWVEIKGSHLAPAGDVRIWQGLDFVNNQMPTQLDGVSVTVNGKKAFVYFISGTQVNILTPPDAITGQVQVQASVAT